MTIKRIILPSFILFLLFVVGSFCVIILSKWRLTSLYSIEICTHPRNPIVSEKEFYYYATLQSYYFVNSSYLLEPVKLYYPAMFPFFAMTSEKDAWKWVNNVYTENSNNMNTFQCLVDKDNSIGITKIYNAIMGWILLLMLVIISVLSILVYIFKNRGIQFPSDNHILYFSGSGEIPPLYTEEDPVLPDYERGSYDRTPPSDVISMNSYNTSNPSITEEVSI